MNTLRILLRVVRLLLHMFTGLFLTLLFLRGVEGNTPTARQKRIIQNWLSQASRIIGLRIRTKGEIPNQTVLVVANHISWLDIPAIASALPVSFLSKAEIRAWPIIGKLTGGSGTLFIKRGARDASAQAILDMTIHMQKGQNIVIFPEATTTDGTGVKRFHARLFAAAIDAAIPVQPVAVRYPHAEGVNPVAPFINDMGFVPHAMRVLGSGHIDVELTFLPVVLMPYAQRKEVAETCRQQILQHIQSISPTHTETNSSAPERTELA